MEHQSTIQLDLSWVGKAEKFVAINSNKHYEVHEHSDATRRELRKTSFFYRKVPDSRLTHYVAIDTPNDGSVSITQITREEKLDGFTIYPALVLSITIPSSSFEVMLQKIDIESIRDVNRHLKNRLSHIDEIDLALNKDHFSDIDLLRIFTDSISYVDAKSTAAALLYHHVDLMQLDGNKYTPAYVYNNIILESDLNEPTLDIFAEQDNWRSPKACLDENGNPATDPDDNAKLLYTLEFEADVKESIQGPLQNAIQASRDDENLEGELWSVQTGVSSSSYSASSVNNNANSVKRTDANGTRDSGENWQLANISSNRGFTLSVADYDANTDTLEVDATNHWLRHMSVYIGYRDLKGNPIDISDLTKYNLQNKLGLPDSLHCFEKDGTRRWLLSLGPANNSCGIPLPTDPTKLQVPIIAEAAYVDLHLGTMGFTGKSDNDISPSGIILTLCLELIWPPIMLALGNAVTSSKVFKDLLKDKNFIQALLIDLIPVATAYALTDPVSLLKNFGSMIGKELLKALSMLCKKMGGSLAAVTPVFGGAAEIFGAITTAAKMAETLAEAAQAPAYYKVDINRSVDLEITLNPDSRYGKFPDIATSYAVFITYKVQSTSPAFEQSVKLSPETISDPIKVSFKKLPQVSSIQATAIFYADNGWQAGVGASKWVDTSTATDGKLEMSFEVKTKTIPLNKETTYSFKQKIVMSDNERIWTNEGGKPTETHLYQYPHANHRIDRFNGISIGQYAEVLGYSWQATGINLPPDQESNTLSSDLLNLVQTISVLQSPQTSYDIPDVGFTAIPQIALLKNGAEEAEGQNFYLDPSKGDFDRDRAGSGVQVRGFTLKRNEAPDLSSARANSWGRFLTTLDSCVVHPQNKIIGINTSNHKIQVLNIPTAPVADDDAPLASFLSGKGKRIGLLNSPIALGVDSVGTVMVLEAGNNRVQAFDTDGNPVYIFGNSKSKSPFFTLRESPPDVTYLDMAVETKGYIYILLYHADGSSAEQYSLDIYQPDGTFLTTTAGIAAACCTVDILRNVFTLNYELISGTNSPTEPSVSQWIPSAPNSFQIQ